MGSTQSSIATQGPVSTQNTIKQKTTLHTHPLPLHRKRSTHHPTTAATTAATIATATAATTAATKTTTPSPAATTPSVTNTISVHGVCPDPSLMTRSQFNEQQCLQWFKEYTDPDSPQMMTPENTQQFFEDLGVSVEDVMPLLLLLWSIDT
ncbi:hypothetical protein BDF14DRAFT_1812869 [Spinellus fusiger]|nr:hypothetical protein BDF14DRAFT_1812869 [Spinellus fusiger]